MGGKILFANGVRVIALLSLLTVAFWGGCFGKEVVRRGTVLGSVIRGASCLSAREVEGSSSSSESSGEWFIGRFGGIWSGKGEESNGAGLKVSKSYGAGGVGKSASPENVTRLTNVKVAVWYQSITDYKAFMRRLDDVIRHLKETRADFVFRAFWKYQVIPQRCSELSSARMKRCERMGYSYEDFEETVRRVKEEIPGILICAGIPTERIDVNEYDPMTGKKYTKSELWEMALDPTKWNVVNPKTGSPITKEQFQFNRGKLLGFLPSYCGSPSEYDWREVYAYYPDITNPEFQKLQLSWAKRLIDCGADAIWIDMLFAQARMFYELTGDPYHPAVRDSYEAALNQVKEIHRYAEEMGKYVYVGGWTNFLEIKDNNGEPAYPVPDFDFVVNMIWEKEVMAGELLEERWNTFFTKVKKYLGSNVLVLIFMDEAAVKWQDQPLGIFSQRLSKSEQAEFLETADTFFRRKREEFEIPVTFVYPVHGGWMGTNAEILSFGMFKVYDSLAPEFQTYRTIKELARKKKEEG